MKNLTATLSMLALLACSPESFLTPDDCKIESVKKVQTMSLDVEAGRTLYITEAEALAAQADPVAACQELRGRE